MLINVIWLLLVIVSAMIFLVFLDCKISKKKTTTIKKSDVEKNDSLEKEKSQFKSTELLV